MIDNLDGHILIGITLANLSNYAGMHPDPPIIVKDGISESEFMAIKEKASELFPESEVRRW